MPDACTGQTLGPVVPLAKAEGAYLTLAAAGALGRPQEIRRNVRREESRRAHLAGWAKAQRAPDRRLPSDSATSRADPVTPAAPDSVADLAVDQGDALCGDFQRQLWTLLSNGQARPERIEEAPGLMPLQARRWLERMERGGEIERASRNPVAYRLTRKSLL